MGAVFALYSAWYFWIPKILGAGYNKSGGKAHFWILFVGVNVTFFPQHFLGLQGMPRRISDYPDAFAGWNLVSSFGSLIGVLATWLFLYILYVQLVEGIATSRYPWLVPEFSSDLLQTSNTRSYNSLEWGQDNPPKSHTFPNLPLLALLRLLNPVTPGLPPLITFIFGSFFLGTLYVIGFTGAGGSDMPTQVDPALFVPKRDIFNYLYDISFMLTGLNRSDRVTWDDYEYVWEIMGQYRDVIANNLGEEIVRYEEAIELLVKYVEHNDTDHIRDCVSKLDSMIHSLAEPRWGAARDHQWILAFHRGDASMYSAQELVRIHRLYLPLIH